MRSLFGLAFDGLRRKPGRNLLTLAGVSIGVLALTMIVSLGQGLASLVTTTVSGEDNLRQIGVSPGFGFRIGDEGRVEIRGVEDAERRARLERAARARTRPGTIVGRRAEALDDAVLAEIRKIPHVERVEPLVLERYRLREGDHESEASASFGVDVGRRRLENRVVAGRYFSSPDAHEALVDEFLAYRWGYVTKEDLARLLGKTLVLVPIQNQDPSSFLGPAFAARILGQMDLSTLSDEEMEVLPGLVEKMARWWWSGGHATEPAAAPGASETTLEIVGVARELEPKDPLRLIEDSISLQADVFLPRDVAVDLFLAQPVNRELGYGRALVTVDRAADAAQVESDLRDRGLTAFSVASVVQRIDDLLSGLTIVVSLLTGIALFVAALGIVNTMVTSVLERTREIGLWKAVGATRGQVRTVFLLEALAIGVVGAVLGLGLALLAMVPLDHVAARMIAERATVPLQGRAFVVPTWLPVADVLLAATVAVLASLYPAHRAATVDPVRALHHE